MDAKTPNRGGMDSTWTPQSGSPLARGVVTHFQKTAGGDGKEYSYKEG
jgi:hypothetical protein